MKRFISAAICLIMLVGTLAAPAFAAFNNGAGWNPNNDHSLDEVKTFKLGDLDDDGNVALKDLLAIRKHIVDKTVEVNTSAADVIADGKVNTRDLLALRKHFGSVEDIAKYDNTAIVDNFNIAGQPISTFSIVVPQGTTDCNTVYGNAADLFRKFVKMATGYNLTIDNVKKNENAIYFVEVAEDSEMGRKLEVENYIYEVKEGDLYIYSTRRDLRYIRHP